MLPTSSFSALQDGVDLVLRQSAIVDSGRRAHIYSADTRRAVSLQFYPDRYDLVEDSPVLISEGYSSHRVGVHAIHSREPWVCRARTSCQEEKRGHWHAERVCLPKQDGAWCARRLPKFCAVRTGLPCEQGKEGFKGHAR